MYISPKEIILYIIYIIIISPQVSPKNRLFLAKSERSIWDEKWSKWSKLTHKSM